MPAPAYHWGCRLTGVCGSLPLSLGLDHFGVGLASLGAACTLHGTPWMDSGQGHITGGHIRSRVLGWGAWCQEGLCWSPVRGNLLLSEIEASRVGGGGSPEKHESGACTVKVCTGLLWEEARSWCLCAGGCACRRLQSRGSLLAC